MEVLRKAAELRLLDSWRGAGPVVLVPTMGALHEGHLSLVRQGKALGRVLVSIFVNPTQFGPGEDFSAYPRDLPGDLAQLAPLQVDGVFCPDVAELYGADGEVTIQPGRRADGLCARGRPGHFAGVLTVVAKLFCLVRPDVAVFGRKDAQQCLVIAQMVENLRMPVRLVDSPTVREPDGLAMSSRNRYLDGEQRARARCLYRALEAGRHLLEQGERQAEAVVASLRDTLQEADAVEYAEVRGVPELETVQEVAGKTLLAVAARIGPARLIDNLVLAVGRERVVECGLLDQGRVG